MAGVSQPVVSDQIASIESHYGVRLFDRHPSGARPTALGREYVRSADRILAELSQMEQRLQDSADGRYGRLTIGYYGSLSSGTFRSCLKAITRHYPNIRIDPVVAPFTELVHGVRNHAIDLAIVATEEGRCQNLRTMSLWSERVMVALPDKHPLVDRDYLEWADLTGERFLFSRADPGQDLLNLLMRHLASPGRQPDIEQMQVNREDLLSFVSLGKGISLECEAASGLSGLGVVFKEVRSVGVTSRIACSACWRDDNDSPALSILLKLLRNGGHVEREDEDE